MSRLLFAATQQQGGAARKDEWAIAERAFVFTCDIGISSYGLYTWCGWVTPW